VQWQREGTSGEVVADRESGRANGGVITKPREMVKRRVVEAGGDSRRLEVTHNLIPVDPVVEHDDGEVVGVSRSGCSRDQRDSLDRRDVPPVLVGEGSSVLLSGGERSELDSSHGGQGVRQIRFPARSADVTGAPPTRSLSRPRILVETVVSVDPGECSQFAIGRGEGTTLPGGQVLGCVERESCGNAPAPGYGSVGVARSEGVGCVLDDRDACRSGQIQNGVVHRSSCEMDWDQEIEALIDGTGERIGGDLQGVAVDVEEHDRRPAECSRNSGRRVGPRWDTDTTPWWEVEAVDGDLDRRSARVHADHMHTAEVVGQLLFESIALGPGSDPARFQNSLNGGHLIGAD